MFRLFIREKLKSSAKKKSAAAKPQKSRRNRRVYERYAIDHKHLTMMNEQDILLIREISAKGFSTSVSARSWERFVVGDVFSARMRYYGEIFDLVAKVSWKSKKEVVGFELINADHKTQEFMNRLIYPNEIAKSLRLVDAKFMAESTERKSWYHGDSDTDLYIWHGQEGTITAWRLTTKDRFIEWVANKGINTGTMQLSNEGIGGVLDLPMDSAHNIHDKDLDTAAKQLAIDVMMATEIQEKDAILVTLTEDTYG